ncbi:MAG TPA: helix-turn-helix domain-containing protein [Actinomycetota bacterium]
MAAKITKSTTNGRRTTRAGSSRALPSEDPARPSAALREILDELEQMVEQLAERMLERYLASIPSYRALPDETLRQVREVNRKNLTGFIGALRRRQGPSDEELAFVRASASKRAREGVPLSALLQAYRLGAQLAWGQARELIGEDPVRLYEGLELATAVMHWVDVVSGAVAQAYLEEYERLSSDREAARRDFLDGIIGGALTDEEILARAEALGLDPAAATSIAIVGPADPSADDAVLRAVQHRLKTLAAELPAADRSLVVGRGPEIVIVFPAGPDALGDMQVGMRTLVERVGETLEVPVRAGIGRPRDSLAELAPCYREASIALAAARASSGAPTVSYGEMLIEELILRERGVSKRLATQLLEPLDAHPELKHTLVEYIEHGPSLPAVAKRLFLHPNTVSYRLSRIRDLTGRDPKTPAGIAELFLALRASQLLGAGP